MTVYANYKMTVNNWCTL